MNNSSEIIRSIQEVPMLTKRMFGVEIDFYEMLELSREVLRQTGGLVIHPFLYKAKVQNFTLELPCNVVSIEHVSHSKPFQWYGGLIFNQNVNALVNYRVDQSGNQGIYNPDATSINELGPDETNALYEINKNIFTRPLGLMIDHRNEGNKCLKFNHKEIDVDVLYNGVVLDSDGYPMIHDKSAEALAAYMNHIEVRKKFFMRQASADQEQIARMDRNLAIAHARTPNSLSQNEIDMLLNSMTSSNRKKHNIQFRGF